MSSINYAQVTMQLYDGWVAPRWANCQMALQTFYNDILAKAGRPAEPLMFDYDLLIGLLASAGASLPKHTGNAQYSPAAAILKFCVNNLKDPDSYAFDVAESSICSRDTVGWYANAWSARSPAIKDDLSRLPEEDVAFWEAYVKESSAPGTGWPGLVFNGYNCADSGMFATDNGNQLVDAVSNIYGKRIAALERAAAWLVTILDDQAARAHPGMKGITSAQQITQMAYYFVPKPGRIRTTGLADPEVLRAALAYELRSDAGSDTDETKISGWWYVFGAAAAIGAGWWFWSKKEKKE